jgi:hypothetical protein
MMVLVISFRLLLKAIRVDNDTSSANAARLVFFLHLGIQK